MSNRITGICRNFRNRLKRKNQLSTGFSMLEAVVVVGVLLALAVGGFFAYGPITQNAKTAAVRSAASSVYTAVLVAHSDGDSTTNATDVVDQYNSSNDKLRAEIRQAGTEATPAAMSTATDYVPTSDNDFCVRVTNIATPTIYSDRGNCDIALEQETPVETEPTATPTPSSTPTVEPTDTPSSTPTPTPSATPAPSVQTAGYASTWGYNYHGQLGNNSTTSSKVPIAVYSADVLAGKSITSVSSGQVHTCVIANGGGYCWGRNADGQLGNGRNIQTTVPVAVKSDGVLAGKTITALSSGISHTCAIADGAGYCWGRNAEGQLGSGSTASSNVPVAVNNTGILAGKTITSISSGGSHTCAIADGVIYCWGLNTEGQLGNGSAVNSNVPVAINSTGVLAGKAIASISSGSSHTCAIADGAAYCWGYNSHGQLGNGSTVKSNVPVKVDSSGVLTGKMVTSIEAGSQQTCAVAAGAAYCWGYNYYGQLGNATTINSTAPVAVSSSGALSGKTITSISTGGSHTCAVADGAAHCWGQNADGQLGNGLTTQSNVPVTVTSNGLLAGKTVVAASTGNNHTAIIYQ